MVKKNSIKTVIARITADEKREREAWEEFLDDIISRLKKVDHDGLPIGLPDGKRGGILFNDGACILPRMVEGCEVERGTTVRPGDIAKAIQRIRGVGTPVDRIRFRRELTLLLQQFLGGGGPKGKRK